MANQLISDPKPELSRGIIGALLFTRALSFLMIQLVFASVFQLAGTNNWWEQSQAFWPITAIGGSIITFYILAKMLRAEDSSYWQLIRPDGAQLKRDAPFILLLVIILLPVAYFSQSWFSQLLFDLPDLGTQLLIQPLPAWAAYLSLLMPLAVAMTELPFYFGYGMKRLREDQKGWWPIYLPVFFLALQHSFLPLIFSWDFFFWRFLVFLPMAILLGIFLYWRPKSLPVLMIVHFLMDVSLAYFIIQTSLDG